MPDEAPTSSRHVRYVLHKTDLPGEIIDKLTIVTEVSHFYRAVTIVERPMGPFTAQDEWDRITQKALRSLPGADSGIAMAMGRTFTVEWAGICRPI